MSSRGQNMTDEIYTVNYSYGMVGRADYVNVFYHRVKTNLLKYKYLQKIIWEFASYFLSRANHDWWIKFDKLESINWYLAPFHLSELADPSAQLAQTILQV